MNRNRILATILSLCLVVSLCSCAHPPATQEGRTIIDMSGKEVTIPNEINKVIAGSTQGMDMMLAFGAGDKLISAHKSVFDNPWLEKFCQNYDQLTILESYEPEAESILAMGADIVLLPDPGVCEGLRDEGITAICFRTYTTEEVRRAAELVGEIFGGDVQDKATKWLDEWESAIADIETRLVDVPLEERPVIYEIIGSSYKGLFRTDYGEAQGWLKYGGGQIATLEFAGATWNNLPTEESILATNPDVILINGVYWSRLLEDLYSDVRWSSISALKNDRVHIVPIGCTSWSNYSTGYPLMIYYTFSVLYPDMVDFSIEEMADNFYQRYYGIDFSDEEIDYMIRGLAPDGGNLCE